MHRSYSIVYFFSIHHHKTQFINLLSLRHTHSNITRITKYVTEIEKIYFIVTLIKNFNKMKNNQRKKIKLNSIYFYLLNSVKI